MKKIMATVALVFCSILIVSCRDSSNSSNITATKINSEPISATPVKQSTDSTTKNNKSQEIANDNPIIGTIKDMQNGDLKCYVTVVDVKGKLYEGVGAAFEVCEPEKYVNKNVRMSYELENVSDCQSAEPCGKTIKEWLITKIEILDAKSLDKAKN